MDTRYAHITCFCGQAFQVLVETAMEDGALVVDWDEAATAALYRAHLASCVGVMTGE